MNMNINTRTVARWLCSLGVAGVLAAGLLSSTSTAGGPTGTPKATFVKGDVTASNAAGAFGKVKRNQALEAGGVVKTGENARAELTFPDGSVVRLGPSSELKLGGDIAFDGKSKQVKVEAELVGGQAWAKVATLVGKDAQFKVKTQNAVAGVRGTVFRVNVDKDEATVVKVYNGSVAVGGVPAFLEAGDNKECKENPIKCNRTQIAPPMVEVSAKQFEHLLGEMTQVKIGKGQAVEAATPTPFTAADDNAGEPEWVRWNSARDAGKDSEKSD
jgi:hypothetical protein